MNLHDIISLVFWSGTLVGWFTIVIFGCRWLDKKVDKLLDHWFHPETASKDGLPSGGNIKRDPCWIGYMD